jgi:hypothetical protein
MKGRDVLIGVAIGAFLVLFLTNYHAGKSSPHPKPSASSQSAKSTGSKHKDPVKTHHQAAHKQHTTAAAQHNSDTKPAPAKPATEAQPSTHRLATGKNAGKTDAKTTDKAASPAAKSSGISDGLIVVACLIAIAAALSTVTLTVRGLKAAK